jgi:GNAT superfamily N-acetyltransferase
MIRNFEELAMNAWPSLNSMQYDGWILRFSGGYTRRANSVNPLYPSSLPLPEKLDYCEELYQQAGIEISFKMTSSSLPDGLDEVLSKKGYIATGHTYFQTMDLSTWEAPITVDLAPALSGEWFEAVCRISGMETLNQTLARKILANILPQTVFASLKTDGQIVACGLGVLQNQKIGLFDIMTDANYRKRGFGQKIVEGIISWGRANQAKQAYLQVTQNNDPAIRLYERLGFRTLYPYWYRVKA